MSSTYHQVHSEGGTAGPVWTERGVVTGGADAAVQVAVVDDGGEGGAPTRARPPVHLLPAIRKAHAAGVVGVAADHGLQRIVTAGVCGDLKVWDPETRAVVHALDTTPAEVWCLAHSPVLAHVASGGDGGKVTLWDADAGSRVAAFAASPARAFVTALAYAPDGRRLAVCGADGGVHVLDVDAGGAVVCSTPAAHLLPVRAAAWAHDGSLLYTASDDRRVGVWDVSGGGGGGPAPLVCMLAAHTHWATGVTAAADRFVLASCSADRTAKLWDARKRAVLHTYGGHAAAVWGVAFSPDGGKLATVQDSGVLGIHGVTAVL